MYISMSLYIERDFFAREEVKESNIAIAMRMLEDGKLSLEEVAKYFNLTAEEVNMLSKELV